MSEATGDDQAPAMRSAPTSEERGVVAGFAHNTVAANLVMAVMLIGGFAAVTQLTAQVFPTVDPGIVTVSVPYPGATPTEVAEGITRRVEEAVLGIDGVDRVVSKASENMGSVTVELKDFVDASRVRDDVESAVQQIADFPPEDAEEPDIVRAETISDVMTLVVSGALSEKELRRAAELVEEELLALPAVTLVSLVGARDYEIAIEVREEALRRYGLTIAQVANSVRSSSLNLSSGEIRTEAGDLLLRTNTKRERGEEFEDIPISAQPDGTILRLGDVANVRDDFADVDLVHLYNGRPSLFVKVQKSEPEDVLAIAEEIKLWYANYQLPPGVELTFWEDQTEILGQRLSLLVRNGVLGFALVFLFLVVMLDLRLAFWVSMGVPISFFGGFLFFDFLGVNINMVSLFALIIVLGIVVDDAVVVGENISAEREAGLVGPAASIAGVRGVLSPVLVGVLTTMTAFAPLLFVTGIMGQILGSVAIVVIAVLAMSLVEAFFILPAHLSHPGKWSRWPLDAFQDAVGRGVRGFRDNILRRWIASAVRHRYLTLLFSFALPAVAITLLATGQARFLFFPNLEGDEMSASVEFPVGTPFAVTRAAAEQILAGAEALNEQTGGTALRAVSVTIGGSESFGGVGPGGTSTMNISPNVATVDLRLRPEPPRTQSANELSRIWRRNVGDIPGVERLTFVADQFGPGADLEYELAHQDDATLEAAVEALKDAYRTYDSTYEIQDSNSLGKRQYDIELTPAGEAAGLTPADVARQLRRNFFGDEVHRVQRGRSELKVMVRYPNEQRRSTQDLFNVRIRLADGVEAPLSSVARVTESRSFSSIDRVDGLRVVTVSAAVDTDVATPTEVNADLVARVLPELRAQFPGLQVMQAGFGREQSQDLASLASLMPVTLLIIFALMASQLRSYVQPLIILVAVPYGAAGAVIGHWVLGFDISFVSVLGMVALSGVVVNDSIVLIDRYNQIIREGASNPAEAVVTAAQRRFRAIFLTTATTALGLTPMLFETNTQAQFLIPMAVSLATGIVFASVVILFLVPSLIVVREDIRNVFRGQSRRYAAA